MQETDPRQLLLLPLRKSSRISISSTCMCSTHMQIACSARPKNASISSGVERMPMLVPMSICHCTPVLTCPSMKGFFKT
jgi:hypothetical protein